MVRGVVDKSGIGLACALSAATLIVPSAASAEVRREGQWPEKDPAISLDADGIPRNEALRKVATAAGWSLIVNAPKNDPVSVHVKDQPAGKVLEMLLMDGRYVARRDSAMILIAQDDTPPSSQAPAPQTPPVPPVPPVPAVPPVPPTPPSPPSPPSGSAETDESDDRGSDRVVTGGNIRVERDEVVHDVLVMGGNVEVWGLVKGDLTVMGGNVVVHEGAKVMGDAAAIGGTLTLHNDAVIKGDVSVLGGKLNRGERSRIGGEINAEGRRHDARAHRAKRHKHGKKGDQDAPAVSAAAETQGHAEEARGGRESSARRALREAGDAIARAVMLFVYGTVLIALAGDRTDQLKLQIASRPMRTFATGIVGSLAAVVVLAVLCVTIIGIPFAVIGLLLGCLAVFGAMCSVLETFGAAVLNHRTKNPYVHLAFGCLVYLISGAIPVVGGIVTIAVVFTAIGSLVATRCAGLIPAGKNAPSGSPYRDAPEPAI